MILPNLALKLVTAPVNQPVSLVDAKDFLRVTTSDDDALITSLIDAATRKSENYNNRFYITQTWDVWIDHVPLIEGDSRDFGRGNDWWDGTRDGPVSGLRREPDFFSMPRGQVQSITEFNSYNLEGTPSVFTGFDLDDATEAARLFLKNGQFWPTDLRDRNAIQITTVYGYGDNGSDVPSDIQTAIKIILFGLYENRGCDDCSGAQYAPNGKASSMNSNAACLLDPYTIERLE